MATELTPSEMRALQFRLTAVERKVDVITGTIGPAGTVGTLDFLSQTRGSPGFVVDPGVARETPCLCYEIDNPNHSELCFSKGIVGALDKDQIGSYCPTKDVKPLTPRQKARLEDFQSSADACKLEIQDIPKGEEMDPWMACMHRELKARGRDLSGSQVYEQPPVAITNPAAKDFKPAEFAQITANESNDPPPSTPDEYEGVPAAYVNEVRRQAGRLMMENPSMTYPEARADALDNAAAQLIGEPSLSNEDLEAAVISADDQQHYFPPEVARTYRLEHEGEQGRPFDDPPLDRSNPRYYDLKSWRDSGIPAPSDPRYRNYELTKMDYDQYQADPAAKAARMAEQNAWSSAMSASSEGAEDAPDDDDDMDLEG